MAGNEGQPSLQKLCESKSLEQILRSDNVDSEFASLEPRLQQLLFRSLRTENARLRAVEREWHLLTKGCPRLDTQIYLSSTRIEPGGGEDEQNGYDQQEAFLRQWSYKTEDGYDGENSGGEDTGSRNSELVRETSWHEFSLVSQSPDSELTVCSHRYEIRCSCRPKGWSSFFGRVSSQLLLYRLIVTFGMPPPQEVDGYKSCWQVDLQYHDGKSVMSFQDYKGGPDVRFRGTAEASAEALKLLNFLVGMNCLHSYDGIVAGTIA